MGNMISGNGKNYRIQFKGLWKKMMSQAKYYTLGYFRKGKKPFPITEERKFNPLQAVSYMMSMYIGLPLIVITGWGLLFPEALIDRIFGVSGLLLTDLVHVVIGFLLSVFMIIHIYLCSIGKSPRENYRAIITGWGEIDD
jgi:thiosulfate reductase cytochrome b subunit